MAAVVTVSDSDESVDEDGIGKALSKDEWKRLLENGWLTDKIIDNYLELLKTHLQENGQSVIILDSHFTSKFLRTGYPGVCNWHSKVNFGEADYVLTIFNHRETHWTMMVIEPKEKRMVYYDSFDITRTPCFSPMKNYFQQRLGIPQDTWQCKIADGIPRQTNYSDCGVFLLEYARCLLLSQPMLFTQEMTTSIRHRMEQEVRTSQLHWGCTSGTNPFPTEPPRTSGTNPFPTEPPNTNPFPTEPPSTNPFPTEPPSNKPFPTEPPSTNPFPQDDSDFDTESCHKFKRPPLFNESNDENEPGS